MEIFNKNVEVVGSLKVNALNAQGDLLTVDPLTNIVTRRSTSEVLVDFGISTYIHDQGTSSIVWTIVHNLDKRPSATVVDTAGTVVSGEISYVSNNEIEINFNNAFSGKAYLN
ncbi:MAG: hypothetical protein ACKVJK_12170 [Methylophagaceae bacterium]|tara:strand:+ start:1457 stop:1795 length:339 start_codon:yes stop_codon:yes gene_type:complete